jgi:heme/copper-type cytochrome/quinol oxidase subunit 1|tara:strand:- start:31 stop:300 length:270 start_codon:yes stop_codon:yes gene_type:complete
MSPKETDQQVDLVRAYKDVFMHNPQGRLILKDLMKTAGLFQITGVRENADLQHLTGTQDMVRRIIQMLGVDDTAIMNFATSYDGEFTDE